ncbi:MULTISPECIES: phosphotransferase family protein [unclassified Variovorax]|uniref:phosphotransferase family protein n=1 Tax=unclassified Variovorax TaxID=663243 RepID=UPI001BD3E882|nr:MULTISPECIES: phosphotransferase family protein [unclassified Variovorax]
MQNPPERAAGTAGFDPERLDAFLQREVPGLRGPMQLERIGGGQSNPTFFLSYDNRRMVLRKKPAGVVLPSAHAVDREYRVMRALADSALPVPSMVLYCESVDVVGTPFYVMDRIEGRIFPTHALPGVAPAERRALYLAMADTMATLHRLDWAGFGLEGFGKRGAFFERQLRRWAGQWALSRTGENADLDTLLRWLGQNLPEDDETTLVHGDFKIGNLMYHPSEPRVIGVLDWELSTLGHPLADVAFNTVAWRTLPTEYDGIRGLDLAALGIPSEVEYLDRYYRAAGRRSKVQPFHWAFAFMRWAVIFEGIAARSRAGTAVAGNAAHVGSLAAAMARRGLEAIDEPMHTT